jgi:hypothetical protein
MVIKNEKWDGVQCGKCGEEFKTWGLYWVHHLEKHGTAEDEAKSEN